MRVLVLLVGLLTVSSVSFGSVSNTQTEVLEQTSLVASTAVSKQKKTFREKLTYTIAKKLYKKAQRKAKKRGLKPMAQFEDFVALAGAIVCIVGIISIISNLVGGIIVGAVGLLIYALAKANGGSIGAIFS